MTNQNSKALPFYLFNLKAKPQTFKSGWQTNRSNPRILDFLNPSKSRTGFTLVELMIALLISSILVILIYEFFDYQQKSYTLQDQLVEVQQNLRVAMDAMTRDLRMTGYGVPSATSPSAIAKITNATEKSFTYLSNRADVHTELSSDYSSGTSLSVSSRTGFDKNDTIYISDGSKWDQATISSSYTPATGAGNLTISSALSTAYATGSTIHVVNTITYTIDTTDKELTRKIDGGSAQPVCNNLEYLQFKYYDGNNTILANPNPYTGVALTSTQKSQIRRINIFVIGKTSKFEKGHTESGTYNDGTSYSDSYHRTDLESDVMLRNMGL